MNHFQDMPRFLIITGLILIVVGIVFVIIAKVPFLGKLPGDIYIQRKNFSFYFPLTTCIIISVIISLILLIIRSLR